MYIEDLRINDDSRPFNEFLPGEALYKKSDPTNIFIKTDEIDEIENNAVYLDNGELFRVDNSTLCCKVKYRFILEK